MRIGRAILAAPVKLMAMAALAPLALSSLSRRMAAANPCDVAKAQVPAIDLDPQEDCRLPVWSIDPWRLEGSGATLSAQADE